ncbi:TPA: restriction endonuclease subunit S [Escherichia coli]|nr:restriction endonuclease subunit S [Escherichia coli]
MSEWTPIKLGSIVNITNGFAFKSENFLTSLTFNTLPVLKIKNVANGDVHLKDVQYHLIDSKYDKYTSSKGDILITLTGNHPQALTQVVGAVSKQKFDTLAYINQRVAKIDPISSLAFKDSIYYFLKEKSTHDYLASQSSGSANQANISKADIENVELLLPPVTEQIAIASVLSSLDDKIDLLHHQNKTLESMAETLFRQWFIEEAQADWEITTLDCHITVAKGLSYKGSGLTTSDNGIPLFSLNSVLEGGGYKSAGLKYYNGDFKERHIINPGDIIVANTEQGHEYRLIGYPAIIPTIKSELSIYTHHLFKISINDDSYLTNAFLYYLLCSKDMHEQVVAATNGSTVNQLSADGLQRPEFKLPPECMVKEFTTQIDFFWKKISINNSQIKNIESLRDTLLPKLMSGEVRVQYAEEAIASVA